MPVRFDAAADRLLRTTDLIDYNAPYTWMAWIYLVSDLNAISTCLAFDNSSSRYDILGTGADGSAFAVHVGNVLSTNAVGTNLTLNTWYHVAMVRESVTSCKGYLNGSLDVTNTRDVTGRLAAIRMECGAYTAANSNRSDSRVDRIKVWSAALTIEEIQAEMHSIRPQRTANLYGFWPTWTGADRITDYSGNGRDWTASGTLTDEDPAPVGWGAQSTRLILPATTTTYADTGSAVSLFVGSGLDVATLLDAGNATSILVGSGADAATFADIGTGVLGAVGSGADAGATTYTDTGGADAILVGSGADIAILVDSGTGVLIAIGSGADSGGLPIIRGCATLTQQIKPLALLAMQAKPSATLIQRPC